MFFFFACLFLLFVRYLRMHRRPQQGQAVGLLHVAVDQSNLEIVSLLLSEGAEVRTMGGG